MYEQMMNLLGDTVTVEYKDSCYHGRLFVKFNGTFEVCDDDGSWSFQLTDISSIDDRIVYLSHKNQRSRK